MTSKRLNEFTEKTAPTATMFLPVYDSIDGVDYRINYTAIQDYILTLADSTNNARVFFAKWRLNGDYDASKMTDGANGLTGLGAGYLASGQVVLRYHATLNTQLNGLWEVQATGSAVRYSKANTADLLYRCLVMVQAGDFSGEYYTCTNFAVNFEVDGVDFSQLYLNGKFGTATDFSEFEADGTLKFNGAATVFKDVVVPFLYKGGAGEAVLATFVGGIKNLQFDVGKFVYLENAEAPHDYKEGSAIELHIHWAVNSALTAGDKVQWQLECAFANMINGTNTGTIFCNPATPTVFGTKTMTVEYTSPVGGTPAGSNIYSSIGTISATDMANVKIGAGFLGTITRITKSAGGTEAGNGKVFGLNIGIHYEVDTIGSRTTTGK